MSERSDFNDLAREQGLGAVRDQLAEALDELEARAAAAAAEPVTDEPPPPPPDDPGPDGAGGGDPGDGWRAYLARTSSGAIANHVSNLARIMAHDSRWTGQLRYCEFSYRVLWGDAAPVDHFEEALQDADIARLRDWFHRHYGMTPPPRSEIQDAVVIAAQKHRVHPVRDYLAGLRHDGQARLDTWLSAAFDAAGSPEYLALVGRRFLISAVARIMRPGCKADSVLILEGKQGSGKSSALGDLFGDWFSDAPIPLGDKDSYQLIQGVWGYEMAELDALSKTESTTAKAFFSQRSDRFRPPYGSGVVEFPRQTVFCGSTNQDEYLKDYSGNRRYWPVLCRAVDREWLALWRDQLWAEALAAYQAGERWWVEGDDEVELCEAEQAKRLSRDAWEEIIASWLADPINRRAHYTAADILVGALQIDVGHIQRAHQNRLSPIMHALGYGKARVLRDGQRVHCYERPQVDGQPALSAERSPATGAATSDHDEVPF